MLVIGFKRNIIRVDPGHPENGFSGHDVQFQPFDFRVIGGQNSFLSLP
jgi:hypothetical protein